MAFLIIMIVIKPITQVIILYNRINFINGKKNCDEMNNKSDWLIKKNSKEEQLLLLLLIKNMVLFFSKDMN